MARASKPVALCGNSRLTKEEREARLKAEQRYKGNSDLVYECPEELTTELEQELYMFIVDTLRPVDILQNLDIFLIVQTVKCIVHMRSANDDIIKYGSIIETDDGRVYKNPAVGVYKDFYSMFVSNSIRLGLSPSDRAKLAVLDTKQKQEEADPLLKLLADRDNDY